MCGYFAYMYDYAPWAGSALRGQKGLDPLGAGVTDGCEPCGCWEPHLSPVKTLIVLSSVLTTAAHCLEITCSLRLLRGFLPFLYSLDAIVSFSCLIVLDRTLSHMLSKTSKR